MHDLRIATVGAGALGGYIAGKMIEAGFGVTIIDRGAHLEAIRDSGLHVIGTDGSESRIDVKATDNWGTVGHFDVIFLVVKAHQIEAVAPRLPALFDNDTVVVTPQNGIPWWYFHGHGGRYQATHLASLDPGRVIDRHIPAERVIGCVAHAAATRPAPGTVRLVSEGRFPVGEPGGTSTERLHLIVDLLESSGLRSRPIADIRAEIWLKALGSASFNPISALTRSTLIDICTNPETRALVRSIMEEVQRVAHALGIEFRRTIDERIAGAAQVGRHKTSMLQDLEAGEALEVEALLGSIRELGDLTGNRTPIIDAVYALTKRLSDATAAPRDAVAR